MKIYLLTLFALNVILGCTKKEDCNHPVYYESPVFSVDGPETTSPRVEIELSVHSFGPDGCTAPQGKIGKETINGNERIIEIFNIKNGCDQVCTYATVDVKTSYKFKASTVGVYTLKFISDNNQYVEHQITVQ